MGWIQNLWNKIRGNKQAKLAAGYKTIENKMDKYALNVKPTPNGKSQEEDLLEEIFYAVDEGASIDMMMKKYHMLTPAQINACFRLANSNSSREDIELVGGIKAVVGRMVKVAEDTSLRYGYTQEQIGSAMPNCDEILVKMMDEKMQAEYKKRFTIIHPMRKKALKLLYNCALDLAIMGAEDSEEILVDYSNRMGDIPITMDEENPMIEDVDVKAAIQLASDVYNKKITDNELKEVGGPTKVINEMSIRAKMHAFENSMSLDKATDFLGSPKDIISNMCKETDKGIEY